MRKLIVGACLFFTVIPGFSKVRGIVKSVDPSGNWFWFDAEAQVSITDVLKTRLQDLGIESDHSFIFLSSITDDIGMEHIRYQQIFKGVKVEGAQFLVHGEKGIALWGNGRVVKGILASPSPSINGKKALDLAMDHLDATGFFWDDPEKETLIKRLKRDPKATFRPTPELVYTEQRNSQDGGLYSLAWKIDLFAEGTIGHKTVFVEAKSGEVLYVLEGHQSGSAFGTAVTRYHGTVPIITDSLDTVTFRLRDTLTTLGGIETYNLHNTTDVINATDFFDSDNLWDNANAAMDEAAGDTHWAMEKIYEYYLNVLGRDSYDDSGSAMLSYIHFDNNVTNAFWNGSWATFGDGNANPLVYIDVVSHEFAHGLTGTSAGLIYAWESGALNESFSDIFGTAVEFAAFPGGASWNVGILNYTFRDMSNPKSFGDPDTYKGQNWWTSAGDNGGVHVNSGVQNFWYYLLVEGGTGVNDLGDPFSVTGLGFDTASLIAYRNLTTYLIPSSTFFDAHLGSIQSAIDLYGCGSFEMMETARAWQAVGIGADTVSNDLEILEVFEPLVGGCDLTTSENISISFQYHKTLCGTGLGAGDVIPLGYRINNGPEVLESITLSNTLNDGDVLLYTFTQTADLSAGGTYLIDLWVGLPGDFRPDNDTIFDYTILRPIDLDNDFHIGFENAGKVSDTFDLQKLDNSAISIKFNSRNTGLFGVEMTGESAPGNYQFYTDPAQNFIANPDFVSRVCMCVDATQADSLRIYFDLRQTYSTFYQIAFQQDQRDIASSIRVTADGVQMGPQFHPNTNISDTFSTHNVSLNSVAGTNFELCLEGQHIYNSNEDPIISGKGDYSHLDNIRVNMYGAALGVAENIPAQKLNVYPNPGHGKIFLELNFSEPVKFELKLWDLMGKEVYSDNWNYKPDSMGFWLDLEGISAGMYTLSLHSGDQRFQEKILVK
jgi:Zn-dependent metalloprotease